MKPTTRAVCKTLRFLKITLLLLPLFILVAFSAFGCGRTINRTAERKIREALPDAIGPARVYKVHIESAALRTIQGRFSDVTIEGEDVQFPTGILMDKMHIDLKNVRVDTGKGRVTEIGEAKFMMTLSEKSLDEYLAGEAPVGETFRKSRLTLGDNNNVTFSAERVIIGGIGVPFRLTGPLLLINPKRIEIDAKKLTVVGIPFTGGVLAFIKKRIESSIDLNSLPVKVYLSEVTTQRGSIMMTGTLDTQDLLRKAQESH